MRLFKNLNKLVVGRWVRYPSIQKTDLKDALVLQILLSPNFGLSSGSVMNQFSSITFPNGGGAVVDDGMCEEATNEEIKMI